MNQAYRDGLAVVGVNVTFFALALAFWAWAWPPGIVIPVAGALWRVWRACS